ncbi:hypothetical protein BCR37DRAFT_394629 [Protomyces lactucae-debilis]|uniref:DUF5672 domain-containing protein n=1 Tax=Protomyces lactucae-debilis TaxID=2754530 RepID=A0A1Y2F2L9_PROLT|nr:uncharacterized protein BCR37DRAFT_394629 [Protomyces lactucae-debilis]ORY78119.1 hypothetical protein BCR37DRAFT_394629 [Protomyces lactucae-debilis]
MTCIDEGALAVLLYGLACHVVVDLLDAVVMQVPLQPWSFCLLLLGIIVLSTHLSKDDGNKQDNIPPFLECFIALAGILCVLYAASGRRPSADIASPAAVSVTVGKVSLNMTKVASLIETRPLPILVPFLSHWLANVPEDWPFVVWTSPEAKDQMLSSATLSRAVASGRLNLTILPDWVDVSSGEHLSRFLTKPWYWHAHDPRAEWMLFFQADSMLCAASEQTVDDWLGYDFVGAPCPWSTHDGHHGGNGGLSMRKISSMQRITNDRRPDIIRQDNTHSNWRQYHGTPHEAEDWWALSRIEMLVPDARWPEDRSQNTFSISWGAQDAMRPLGVHRGFVGSSVTVPSYS